jgi:hypothetical protein
METPLLIFVSEGTGAFSLYATTEFELDTRRDVQCEILSSTGIIIIDPPNKYIILLQNQLLNHHQRKKLKTRHQLLKLLLMKRMMPKESCPVFP